MLYLPTRFSVSFRSYNESVMYFACLFQYGLYSSFMGCFVYCVFGSSKDITVGPTAIMSLMTAEQFHGDVSPDLAVVLAFFTGVIVFACGFLRLGNIIDLKIWSFNDFINRRRCVFPL
jgi:hypothetical protein